MDERWRNRTRARAVQQQLVIASPLGKATLPERHLMFEPSSLVSMPIGAHRGSQAPTPAPQTSYVSAAQPSLDMQSLLDPINGSRASAQHRFNGVCTWLESNGAAIGKTFGVHSSLQAARAQTDDHLAALQAHHKKASPPIETLETRLAETGTTPSAPPAPPNNEAIDDVVRRLELL